MNWMLLLLLIAFIGIFLLGMTLLREGLFQLSGESLKNWLAKLTDTPLKGLILGTIITGILQSSSAVMVITISLIAARLLKFPQTIGIILGTNIGTTFSVEFITFKIDPLIVPLAIIGVILMLSGRTRLRYLGYISFGISAVFTSMKAFEFIAIPLSKLNMVNELFQMMGESHLLAVVVGSLITAIVQSSTAVTGMAMGFLSGGVANLETGIAIMLGANIGTCVTAFLASIGSGRESRLTAYAHIWLNIVGVIAFFPMIGALAVFSSSLAPEIDVQLAHASVAFNVISSLVVLPFANQYAKLILKVYDRKK